jgi:hypothetical protein
MHTDTLRCCLGDDWQDSGLVRTHEHGLASHGIPRDDLAQATRRKHLIPGRIVYEWTLPDGRRWLRAERRRPATAAEESAHQDVHERGEEVAAAVLAYVDIMAPEHALSSDGRWRLRQLIIRQVCYVLQRWPASEATPPGTESSHGPSHPQYRR